MSDAHALRQLQEIDLSRLRLQRRAEEMPELEALKQVQGKIDEVGEKSKQISAMRSNAEVEMQQLADEDAELAIKAESIGELILEKDKVDVTKTKIICKE